MLLAWELVSIDQIEPEWLPVWLRGALLAVLLATSLAALARWWHVSLPARCAAGSLAYLCGWQLSVAAAQWRAAAAAQRAFAGYGAGGMFVIGLLWLVWLVERESRRDQRQRRAAAAHDPAALNAPGPMASWRPLDPAAWYYGRHRPKVNQSIALLTAYSLLFLLVNVLSNLSGASDSYDLPGGGGGGGSGGAPQAAMAQAVRVQKVVKRKFVINPYSSIKFADRPVDDVKLQLVQSTEHLYTVGFGQGGAGAGRGKGFGYGDGDGSGFAGGTGDGKVRFIRLEYSGGDWNQDFGVGADQNLLIEYGVRTGQKVAERTESRTVAQLGAFPQEKSPPLIYLTGQGSISLSKGEIKTLREYLLDKHGMLFGDNGGSQHFHNQFFALMRQVLPNVDPVRVPLDDELYRVPFVIASFPYVAPHGGRDAWGWKVDGRWVCYYHPGDIGDAWSDGHSGISRDVWDACYRLGINVIFYAHVEYSKWLMARHKH